MTKEPPSSTPGGTDGHAPSKPPGEAFVARFFWRAHELVFWHEKRDLIARYHEQGYLYEQPLVELVLGQVAKLGRRGVFYDVGAHVGNHSVAFAKSGLFAAGVALEPHPGTFRMLEVNLRVNDAPNVLAVPALVGADTRVVRVVDHDPDPGNTGMRHARLDDAGAIRQQFALDDVPSCLRVPAQASLTLVKIDVEGAELAVLEGARKALSTSYPVVMVESASLSAARAALPTGYKHFRSGGRTPTHVFVPEV